MPATAADRTDPQRKRGARARQPDRADRSAGAARAGADAVRGRALGRPDFDRTADDDDRAPAFAPHTSCHHLPAGFPPPWVGQPHVTTLTLNRLSQRERARLVGTHRRRQSAAAGLARSDRRAHRRRAPVRRGTDQGGAGKRTVARARDRYVLDQPTQEFAIPTTLQGSLMARVDRLGSAREVLQIGAAIGQRIFL